MVYVFTLNDCSISWKSQLQGIIALSTTESKYIAATEAIKEAIWLQGIMLELKMLDQKVTMFSDSQSALHLC